MIESTHLVRGLAYVPGRASGELHRGTPKPGAIALVDMTQALLPVTPPAAYIIVGGTPLSHAMIELVARGIPTILINAQQEKLLIPGSRISVDGATGLIIEGGEISWSQPIPPTPRAGDPIHLADGTEVWLMASVRSTEQAHQALISGASGIGLVRSEFLASDARQPPKIARLTRELENLCIAAGHLTVTIRLIDIAADKPPRWLPKAQDILNPLGMQGSRLYPYEPIHSVVRNQLAALAALSEHYPVEVLIPFVGRRVELLRWIEFVRRVLPKSLPVGAMAETPAAVLDLTNWRDLADFISIGTNDLIQFYFGADRDEPALSEILDPYTPAIYCLLQQVADAAMDNRGEIRLCGVLPRLPGVLPVLIGLGFRHFSVDPVWIPYLAEALYGMSSVEAEDLARRVCHCRDSKEVGETLGFINPMNTPWPTNTDDPPGG